MPMLTLLTKLNPISSMHPAEIPPNESCTKLYFSFGRLRNENNIGFVMAFLCSDEARWVNGQRIEVGGGINV